MCLLRDAYHTRTRRLEHFGLATGFDSIFVSLLRLESRLQMLQLNACLDPHLDPHLDACLSPCRYTNIVPKKQHYASHGHLCLPFESFKSFDSFRNCPMDSVQCRHSNGESAPLVRTAEIRSSGNSKQSYRLALNCVHWILADTMSVTLALSICTRHLLTRSLSSSSVQFV